MGTDPGARGGGLSTAPAASTAWPACADADASIFPIKLDDNTGIPAYVARGGVVARKVLEERRAGGG
jgi:hypothetical protein